MALVQGLPVNPRLLQSLYSIYAYLIQGSLATAQSDNRGFAGLVEMQPLRTVLIVGMLVQVHPDGHALQALYDSDGSHINRISAVTEAGNRLYFGNLAGDYVSFIEKPPSTCKSP